jgi:hypothetical protein
MKLNQLKEGYIIIKSPRRNEYEYATPASTYTMGIYSSGALRSSGETKVFVHGVAKKGSKVRSRLEGDGGMSGQAVLVTDGFATSHLQIGTALETGRDKLINVSLDIRYVSSVSLSGEIDPVFTAHAAAGVTAAKINNWDTAYSWGDHPVPGTEGFAYRAISSATTITATDYQINVTSGTFTQPLPTAVGAQGKQYAIKNSGTGVVTVSCSGAQTIDGETTQTVDQYENLIVVSNNANWLII